MDDLYQRLRERLDEMSTGYPKTESGVEIVILKRLFNEEEAELFLMLTPMLEAPSQVANRLNKTPDKMAALMEQMAKKGLLFRKREKDNRLRYGTLPFVIGIMEHQLKTKDTKLFNLMDSYFKEAFGKTIQEADTPLMRTIPVDKQIVHKWPVAPYEDALQIIDSQNKIAVSECICRRWGKEIGNNCSSPTEESCFSFGSTADYYVENKMGRYIDAAEAKEIIKKNLEKAPMVLQPTNSLKAGGLCMCCGDCCGMLRSLKLQPDPAASVKSNYYAKIDSSLCEGCEVCIDRCQMDALTMRDDAPEIELKRCIGCGLCVTGCPAGAIELVIKKERYVPPKNMIETYMGIASLRGKMG